MFVHTDPAGAENLYEEIIQRNLYLRGGVELFDGDCIFDLGSGSGLFAVFAAQQARELVIYALEPRRELFEILQLNAKAYGLNAQLFDWSLPPSRAPLSTIIKANGVEDIDLLRVDLEEGAEIVMSLDPQDWRKIRQVSMKVHNRDVDAIRRFLADHGYSVVAEEITSSPGAFMAYAVRSSEAGTRFRRAPPSAPKCWSSEFSLVSDLRQSLHDRLPNFMIPAKFVILHQLPVTENGKIDRLRFPAPAEPSAERSLADPSTETEQVVARIWSQVLGVEHIGVHDDFFEIGGHSLRATQIVSRIRSAFDVDIPLERLFECSTVSRLSAVIEELALNQIEQMTDEQVMRVSSLLQNEQSIE